MKPVGIYVRVSRKGDREDDRFHSPKEQGERAAALARAKGHEVGPTYEDIDVSGATAPEDRPAMSRLLAALDAGEVGGIAAYSLDRLSREPAHGDALVKRVTKAGGVILTPDIPDAIHSPTGEFTFGMLLQVAKLYRSQARARWASATERAILAGIPVGRTALGYRKVSDTDRRIEVDPQAAPIVRECYEVRAAGGGWYKVVDLLVKHTGHRWTVSGARELIRNELYKTGRLKHGDLISEWDAGTIVDEALWAAAQRRGEPASKPSRSEGRYLLSGLTRCASCGKAMDPRPGNGAGDSRRYKCRIRTCSERASIKAATLERYVILQSFAIGDELEQRAQHPDLADLEAAVATAKQRLDWVTTAEAIDALGPGFAATAKKYRAAHEAAVLALGDAQHASGYGDEAMRLRELWDDLSPVDRREAMRLFWKEMRVSPKIDGKQAITPVARGAGREAEIALPLDPGVR
jgi:DNA invertase Pin-like site-specific DNA recombinase